MFLSTALFQCIMQPFLHLYTVDHCQMIYFVFVQGSIVFELQPTGNGIGYFRLLPNGVIETARSFNMSQRNVFNYTVCIIGHSMDKMHIFLHNYWFVFLEDLTKALL